MAKITDINVPRMIYLMFTQYSILGVIYDTIMRKAEMCCDALKAERRKTCSGCKDRITSTNQCSICGCWITAKTMYSKSKCPNGYWT